MIHYTPPSVDNLVNSLPDELGLSRQFVAWSVEHGRKKVPLKADGSPWGDYNDPKNWRTLSEAIDLLDRGKAFGIGLKLVSQQDAASLADFNLIADIVAVDGDAKQAPLVTPYQVPENICNYTRRLQSYCELSMSLKGLRGLVFGTLPTEKQNITRSFGDGTELSPRRLGHAFGSAFRGFNSDYRASTRRP